MPAKVFRAEEIAKHVTEDDLWFVRNGKVYDITKFVDQHPGGADTLLGVAGKDGTIDFDAVGHSDSAMEDLDKHYIGELHPEDVAAMQSSTTPAKTNLLGLSIVFLLVAVCAYFIFTP